jgi:DNA-directed RNA polymerase subunit H (RpoH/RPB5)
MLVMFFDWKDIVNHEFVPRGQTVNKQLYQEVLARLRFGREVLFSALVWTLEM